MRDEQAYSFLLLLLLRLDVRSFRHTNTQARTNRRPVPFFSSSVRQRGERMHLFPFSFLLLGHSLLFLIGSNESAMTRIVGSCRHAGGKKGNEMIPSTALMFNVATDQNRIIILAARLLLSLNRVCPRRLMHLTLIASVCVMRND